jgi:hypothetical protein
MYSTFLSIDQLEDRCSPALLSGLHIATAVIMPPPPPPPPPPGGTVVVSPMPPSPPSGTQSQSGSGGYA